jgi:hypothetical protein
VSGGSYRPSLTLPARTDSVAKASGSNGGRSLPARTFHLVTWLPGHLLIFLLLLVVGCSSKKVVPTPEDKPILFRDRTQESGLDFVYRNGEEANEYTILETLGGGVALIDYDQDGLLDIFVTGGGRFGPKRTILGLPNRLFRNAGDWRFRDVTALVGLPVEEPLFYSHGAAVADYDNDGWPDLLVTGYGRMALYRNRKGQFEEVTARAGLLEPRPLHWSTSAAWGDLDGNGWPDLYVTHYVNWSFQNHPRCEANGPGKPVDVCSPENFSPLPDALYLNEGDGTFVDASTRAGLKPGNGLGVVIADLDDDSRPDLYVANDATANHLYWNEGGGRFEEAGELCGVAYDEFGNPDGSMGVAAGDYDGSGRLSLFVTNYQEQYQALYRNRGGRQFHYAIRAAGLAALGQGHVGFGTGFLDFDRDGILDLFFTNGHVLRHPAPPHTVRQRPVLLRNNRRPDKPLGGFEDVTDCAGPYFQGSHIGRGVAFGDLDNDGATDLVISHSNDPVVLLENNAQPDHHWLGVVLEGQPYRDAVGAKLTLEVGSQTLVRAVKGGGSYLSANDPRVLFGLGTSDRVKKLTIRWPSGKTQSWPGQALTVDRYMWLVEGEEQPRFEDRVTR